jgi:hypothetical protein
MSRIWAAPVVLLTITLGSGCVVSETIVVPKASEATIELLRVTPTPGSRVSRDTVIVAELSYRVDDFEAGRFFVMVQAATIEPEVTTMGKGTNIQQPILREAHGTVTLSYPLRHLWDEPTVAKPFEVWFCLNQRIGSLGASVTATKIGPFRYVQESEPVWPKGRPSLGRRPEPTRRSSALVSMTHVWPPPTPGIASALSSYASNRIKSPVIAVRPERSASSGGPGVRTTGRLAGGLRWVGQRNARCQTP